MKIQKGMYVRTKDGIAKYLGLGKNVLTINESNQFKHYANQHLFDNSIFDVGHDWGDTLSNEEFKNIDKYIEKEPSFDLIDLIEVGDYVNGNKVTSCEPVDDKDTERYLGFGDYDYYIHTSEDIKDIVTKEQFEACKYVVERDK